jgi:hypothetical protein
MVLKRRVGGTMDPRDDRQVAVTTRGTNAGWHSGRQFESDPAVAFLKSRGIGLTNPRLQTARTAGIGLGNPGAGYQSPAVPSTLRTGGGTSGGRGGGGGGSGGGAAKPTYDVGWLADLLSRGRPGTVAANTLDLPEYQGTFDPSMYNQLEGRLGEAVGQSRTAADEAYTNLGNYLTSNYRNAFAGGPPQATAPGMDAQAMARMMQGQGVNPGLALQQTEGQAAANAGFGNLWALLAGNEERQQQNRLNRVQTDRGTTNRAIDAASLQGMTGIGLQRSQAQAAFQQRMAEMNQQIAQQEAMANWERANQVSDLNTSNLNSYQNAQIQALLGLVPGLAEAGAGMPDLSTIFGAR